MRFIDKIPVIGKVTRSLIYHRNVPRYINEQSARIEEQSAWIEEQSARIEEQSAWIEEQSARIEEQSARINQLSNRILEQEHLIENPKWRQNLNQLLSTTPTIWGKEERLHISPLSAVFSCLFNTNSGEITVGDYTYAGSNVSLLAGSHDMNLKGLLRRDCEMKEGCDIVIGDGVWLASNAMILGPATIGDNAVIAAGAVVLPGTHVPANTVYAGVPARKIKDVSVQNQIDCLSVRNAMEREDGVLFAKGWSEKRPFPCEKDLFGHWMIEKEAIIYTSRDHVEFVVHKTSDNENEKFAFCYGDHYVEKQLLETETCFEVTFDEKELKEIIVRSCTFGMNKIMVAMKPDKEE